MFLITQVRCEDRQFQVCHLPVSCLCLPVVFEGAGSCDVFFLHRLFHDFGSLVSVLVLFSECIGSSRHLAQPFSSQENETRDALVSCFCVVFFLSELVAMMKDKCNKKKRQATMIEQQSASRVQLPSLSAAKERHASARRTKQMKTRAHAESDDVSGQDSEQTGEGDSSDGEGSASSSTDDGCGEEVIAMSQRTKHVLKKKRSKLKRKDSGSKTFLISCSMVASGRGSLKRVQHLKTLKAINEARMPLALFIGVSDLFVIKVLFVLTGVTPRTRLADFHMADRNEFGLTMRNFYRLCVERGLIIQPLERMLSEDEKLVGQMAGSFC